MNYYKGLGKKKSRNLRIIYGQAENIYGQAENIWKKGGAISSINTAQSLHAHAFNTCSNPALWAGNLGVL